MSDTDQPVDTEEVAASVWREFGRTIGRRLIAKAEAEAFYRNRKPKGLPTKCLVMISAGVTSWAAAMRSIERYGRENVEGLFADTKIEDPDSYRFLDQIEVQLGIKVHRIADGRDPWEVFVDERFIGNSRIDPCSKILKRKLMDAWRDEHCTPETHALAFGLDWDEEPRITRHRPRMAPWLCNYPMADKPWLTKAETLDWMRSCGIETPRLYTLGFSHNNCGGMCVKMGLGQAKHLLSALPDVYRRHERREQEAMSAIGPTAQPFLRLRRGGKTRPISMRDFRKMIERQPSLFDNLGGEAGCGGSCALGLDDTEPTP